VDAASDATEVLVTAFEADPLFAALFPAEFFPNGRRAGLNAWFGIVCQVLGGCSRAVVRSEPNLAAVWTTEACSVCLAELDDALLDLVRGLVGDRGVELLAQVGDASSFPANFPPTWNLHWLAVHPGAVRQGFGSACLRGIRAAASDAGAGLTTMTTNPGARDFYLRGGLLPVDSRPVAGAPGLPRADAPPLHCWTLWAPAH
jgi:GNAT superfamily N-acetyltransferase